MVNRESLCRLIDFLGTSVCLCRLIDFLEQEQEQETEQEQEQEHEAEFLGRSLNSVSIN